MKTTLVALETVVTVNPPWPHQPLPAICKVAYATPEMLTLDALEVVPDTACYGDCEEGHHHFQHGDVLLPGHFAAFANGQCAQVNMTRETGFCPDRMLVLRADPARLDARYLLYFLRQSRMRNFIAVHLQGSKRQFPHTRELLRELKLPLPTLFQQQNLFRQLDHAFELRRKWALEAKSRDTTRRLFFHNFFGTTGTMQQRWQALEMHQLLDKLIIGNASVERYRTDRGEYLIRPLNLGCNRILLDDMVHVQLPPQGVRRNRVLPGDVLLSLPAGQQGQTACAPPDIAPACAGAGVAILRTRLLEPGFLAAYLSSGTGLGEIERVLLSLPGHDLTASAVRAMRLLLPPRAMQQEFVLADHELEADCDAAWARLSQARARFAQLEHEAFRG